MCVRSKIAFRRITDDARCSSTFSFESIEHFALHARHVRVYPCHINCMFKRRLFKIRIDTHAYFCLIVVGFVFQVSVLLVALIGANFYWPRSNLNSTDVASTGLPDCIFGEYRWVDTICSPVVLAISEEEDTTRVLMTRPVASMSN